MNNSPCSISGFVRSKQLLDIYSRKNIKYFVLFDLRINSIHIIFANVERIVVRVV